jgi:hypothetical protein
MRQFGAGAHAAAQPPPRKVERDDLISLLIACLLV